MDRCKLVLANCTIIYDVLYSSLVRTCVQCELLHLTFTVQADMFHVLKASGRFFYDSKLSVYCIPAQSGPPFYVYASDMLRKIDRLGLPFCRLFSYTCIAYLEIFSVFDGDPIIFYVIFLLGILHILNFKFNMYFKY